MNPYVPSTACQAMGEVVDGLPTISAKIIALYRQGYSRVEIARYLEKRYQHVRNVLVHAGYPDSQLREAGTDDHGPPRPSTAGSPEQVRVNVGPGGRIVIPAAYRQVLGIGEGDAVVLSLEGDEVRLVSYETEVRRVRDLVARHVPKGVSLVDALIAERRHEAKREERGE